MHQILVLNLQTKAIFIRLRPLYSLRSRQTLAHKILYDEYRDVLRAQREIFDKAEDYSICIETDKWTDFSSHSIIAIVLLIASPKRQMLTYSVEHISAESHIGDFFDRNDSKSNRRHWFFKNQCFGHRQLRKHEKSAR